MESGHVLDARSGTAPRCRRSQAWRRFASRLSKCSNLVPLPVPPAGFEPALTAPEAVALYGIDQRKRGRRCPGRARIGRGPPTPRSAGLRPAFVSRGVIDTRGFGDARSAAFDMGGNLVRRWPSGAVLNRVVYAQLRADPTADRRPDLLVMEVIVRLQDRALCASITCITGTYAEPEGRVIFDHRHNAE